MDHRWGGPPCRGDRRDFAVSIPSSTPHGSTSHRSRSCRGFEFVCPSSWSRICNEAIPSGRCWGLCWRIWLWAWGFAEGFHLGVGRHFWRDDDYFWNRITILTVRGCEWWWNNDVCRVCFWIWNLGSCSRFSLLVWCGRVSRIPS